MAGLLAREQERAAQIASSQTSKIQYIIENQLYTTHTAEALLKQGNGKIDNFDRIMKEILTDTSIRNISDT